MRRRDFLGAAAVAWLCPVSAHSQSGAKPKRLAIFHPIRTVEELRETGVSFYRAFFGELRSLGYEEGSTLVVDRYSGGGRQETYERLAEQIVGSQPDVIVTTGSVITGRFASAAKDSIPIITSVNDPILTGLSNSLSAPSRSVTGVVVEAGIEVTGKRLELLRELRPGLKHIALLVPRYVWEEKAGTAEATRQLAKRASIRLSHIGPTGKINELSYREAFSKLDHDKPEAILVFEGPENNAFREVIVDLINSARIPAIYSFPEFVHSGGLMAYAVDLVQLYRHMAHQTAALLQGKPVRSVPFYQPHRFGLILNLKTAKALDLTIPPTLLARANEVIE
jgi:putative ABC transport system substrate-binding protein